MNTTTNINTGVNSLPAKVVAALNADNLNVIRVYSYSSTYWNGEQTTAFIIIAETTGSRLLLLSCTEAVPCLACVFTLDDRRKSFPADELDTLIERAESLAGVTETTTDTTNNETPANVTITISKDANNLYTAKANGVPVGSVNGWFNNTFAACYAVGIKQRKALAMPELNHENNAEHGFTSETNAVLWLGDMLVRYFKSNGVNAKVVNV